MDSNDGSLLKSVAVTILVAFIVIVSGYLASDASTNGDPFTLGPDSKPVTVAYPFSIYLNPNNQTGTPDMRVGVFLTFRDTVVAGDQIGVGAKVIIPSPAAAGLRNGTGAAVVIQIPNTVAAPGFNDSTYGIPNDYLLGMVYQGTFNGSIIYGTGTQNFPVVFPDQGDYHVFVGVQTYHFSTGLIEAPNTLIHVEPRSIRGSIVLADESRAFTYALLIFAVFDGLVLLPGLYKGSVFERRRRPGVTNG